MPNTIFITGASTGLGRAAARLFAQKGFKVIATMRRVADGADLAADGVTVLPLDVTDLRQIEQAAASAWPWATSMCCSTTPATASAGRSKG
jgi:NAD(P)-dependent dehydrogenase (short-subunit alcohol dehydrogenase family)